MRRGDPRGEFIALQLCNERSVEQERRMKKLLRGQRDALLGDLAPVIVKSSIKFEGGVLTECELRTRSHRQGEALRGHLGWSTVREAGFPQSEYGRQYAPLVLSNSGMRSLRRTWGVDWHDLLATRRFSPMLETVSLSYTSTMSFYYEHWPEETGRRVEACPNLGPIRRLEFYESDPLAMGQILHGPTGWGLRELALFYSPWQRAPEWLEVVESTRISTLEFYPAGWCFVLQREDYGWTGEYLPTDPRPYQEVLDRFLEVLGPLVTFS
ncbi:MAG: hypothetical protein HN348_36585 [Proteobacteria bacterium]|nr:hypothetical protein [Pseudomonadota bacterium]